MSKMKSLAIIFLIYNKTFRAIL